MSTASSETSADEPSNSNIFFLLKKEIELRKSSIPIPLNISENKAKPDFYIKLHLFQEVIWSIAESLPGCWLFPLQHSYFFCFQNMRINHSKMVIIIYFINCVYYIWNDRLDIAQYFSFKYTIYLNTEAVGTSATLLMHLSKIKGY